MRHLAVEAHGDAAAFELYAFQAVYLSLSVSVRPARLEVANGSSSDLYPPFQPMYATVVVLIVESQRSMMDVWEICPSNVGKLGGSVGFKACPAGSRQLSTSFTNKPVQSIIDNKGGSQRSEDVFLNEKESQVGAVADFDTITIPRIPSVTNTCLKSLNIATVTLWSDTPRTLNPRAAGKNMVSWRHTGKVAALTYVVP